MEALAGEGRGDVQTAIVICRADEQAGRVEKGVHLIVQLLDIERDRDPLLYIPGVCAGLCRLGDAGGARRAARASA